MTANSSSSSMADVRVEKVERKEEDKPHVLLLRPLNFFLDERLSQRFRLLRPWESPLPRDHFLAAHALSVRAILCTGLAPVDAELLESLPRLGCVVTTSAGVDHIDLPECRRRGVVVANAGAAFSEDVAECAVGLLLAVLRRISAADRYVRGDLWSSTGDFPILGCKVPSHPFLVHLLDLGSMAHMEMIKQFKMNSFVSSVDMVGPTSFQPKLEIYQWGG